MKIKHLTKAQKNKVDKIDALMTQLKKDGVYPYILSTAGGNGLTFIRSNYEDRWDIGDTIVCPSSNFKLYDEISEKLYQAYDTDYNNPIDILGM